MKILNRGLRVNTHSENALEVNGTKIIDKDGKIYGDIHASAGSIGTTELADDGVTTAKIAAGAVTVTELASNAVETVKIKNDAVTTAKILNANVTLAKLATVLQPSHVIKFIVLGSTITGSTLGGLLVGDIIMTNPGNGPSTFATCIAIDTLPADPSDTDMLIVFRPTA
jgi:hypothetical protein